MQKTITIKEIINFLDSDVVRIHGNPENVVIKHLRPPESVDGETLDWINTTKKNKQQIAEHSKARVIIADQEVEYSNLMQAQNKILIQVVNPKFAILKIGNHFFNEKIKPGIHETAFIHPHAKLGQNIFVGANASIGACIIGNDVIIFPNVVINDNVIIGSNVTIKAGAVLGFDGFGYERDKANNWVKFPQLGNLIIHDNVEIGSNTCIDKGALSDTVVGFNTKIDNLCHIAHNVKIGKNVIIVTHSIICGSVTIGDNVWIAPNVTIREQKKIGQNATIGLGAVVTKNVPAGEIWFGNPAKKVDK